MSVGNSRILLRYTTVAKNFLAGFTSITGKVHDCMFVLLGSVS